ncbi:MAG: glycosyltransferase family protein [Candidatus Promineifilaceae bacterium]
MSKKTKILLYSHDTFGLGHLRRSLSIAGQIARDVPQAHQLLITGSMVAGAFSLPPRLDLIKLPALSKRSNGRYKARVLPLTLRQAITWREQMILQAVANFQPDLVLVDKVAGGVQGEMLPALHYLRAYSPHTRLVLGMRDIEDSPEMTQREWAANGTPDLQAQMYDAILLYGDQAVFDPVAAYGMSPTAANKLISCGYLRRVNQTRAAGDIRRELNAQNGPLIVVTVGGGGDGYDILKTYLEMLSQSASLPVAHHLLVTGPLMPQRKRQTLRRLAAELPVTFMEFTADLESYLAAADLVISMAGYNTVCELLSLNQRVLLIPRGHTRAEQRIRATLLVERGLAQMLPPEALTPQRMRQAVLSALNNPRPTQPLNLNGLENVGRAIANLLRPEAVYRPPSQLQRHTILEELTA